MVHSGQLTSFAQWREVLRHPDSQGVVWDEGAELEGELLLGELLWLEDGDVAVESADLQDIEAEVGEASASAVVLAAAAGVDMPPQDSTLHADVSLVSRVLDEVLAADVIVIGAPMYNFSVPSQLKAWLDAIAVPGRTFRYDAQGAHGLLGKKRVVIASARGGVYAVGSPVAAHEHHESYLRSFLGFLGVTRIEVVRAEGVKLSPEHAQAAVTDALAQAAQLKAA